MDLHTLFGRYRQSHSVWLPSPVSLGISLMTVKGHWFAARLTAVWLEVGQK
jgi:hypothetical protein